MTISNAPVTTKRCRCPACGEVFSTVSNFDRHRKGDWSDRYCVDPASVDLELKVGANGSWWGMPGDESVRPRKGEVVPTYRVASKNGVAARRPGQSEG